LSNLLSKPTTLVIIACDPNDDKTIYGYIVAELDQAAMILHWVYTKHSFRNFGMAKAMLAEIQTVDVKETRYSTKSRHSGGDMVYDPFTLWRHINEHAK
tara:strand:+ start:412 stop:708 length:297 start_codon:yes stop_codon:yes gene_type:complete